MSEIVTETCQPRDRYRHDRSGGTCRSRSRELIADGGRMQMAYAWYASARPSVELRYLASRGQREDFFMWRCAGTRPGSERCRRSARCSAGTSARSPTCSGSSSPAIRNRIALSFIRARSRPLPPFDPAYPADTPIAIRRRPRRAAGNRRAPMSSACRSDRCAPMSSKSVELAFLLCRRTHPASSSAAVLQASRHGEALRGAFARACARCWPSGSPGSAASPMRSPSARRSSRPPAARCRRARGCCARCWRSSSGSTTTFIISAISPTRRR